MTETKRFTAHRSRADEIRNWPVSSDMDMDKIAREQCAAIIELRDALVQLHRTVAAEATAQRAAQERLSKETDELMRLSGHVPMGAHAK